MKTTFTHILSISDMEENVFVCNTPFYDFHVNLLGISNTTGSSSNLRISLNFLAEVRVIVI